jgi:hypothetical protein
MILFNNQGLITVKNGGTYESVNELAYEADMSYAFEQVVNIPKQTHSLWVTPEGGEEVLLAEDYAFTVATDTINYRSVKMSFDAEYGGNVGLVEITDFTITEVDVREKCLFITHHVEEKQKRDSTLVEHLEKSYNVTFLAHNIFSNSAKFTSEDLAEYDFLFISETAGTFHLETADINMNLRAMPIPTVFTEGYATRLSVFGWTTLTADTGYGAIKDSLLLNNSDKIIITDANPDHPLAAGFAQWEELAIISQAGDDHGTVTFTKPTITEYIEIAWSSADPIEKTIVMGVDKGSTVWNEAGDMDDVVTENRSSFVGVAGPANNYINENGFKLIDAGIDWVLAEGGPSAIGSEGSAMPSEYSLSQNYPNPFNPTTTIAFNLAKSSHTTLTVYNLLGQKVATLLDKEMVSGAHQVTFEQKKLASGVYFYQLRSGDFTKIKKMVLMK